MDNDQADDPPRYGYIAVPGKVPRKFRAYLTGDAEIAVALAELRGLADKTRTGELPAAPDEP